MANDNEIMVSICCITYNHESYIADALEGFLMQKTDFKYEILIHDDASTDKTAEIIRKYELMHPDIIKPIYQHINQYSKGVKILPKYLYSMAKGRYIALCEGDDYWTDENKLQIQFDCLENNPNAVCCYHDDRILTKDGLSSETRLASHDKRDFTGYEMRACKVLILPLTIFFRNLDILRNYPPEAGHVKNGDTFLFSILGQYGSGIYLPMIGSSVYRVHDGGIWSMKTTQEHEAMRMNTWFWISEYYLRLGDHKLSNRFKDRIIYMMFSHMSRHQILLLFLKGLLPLKFVKSIRNLFFNKHHNKN